MSHHVALEILTQGSVGARKKENVTLNHPRYQGIREPGHSTLWSIPLSYSITTGDLVSFAYTSMAIKACHAVPVCIEVNLIGHFPWQLQTTIPFL